MISETYQSNVCSEFTCHASLSKKCEKLTQEGEGLQFSGNACLGKESLYYAKALLLQQLRTDEIPLSKEASFFFCLYQIVI